MARIKYVGTLQGDTEEEARAKLGAKWEGYLSALREAGDIVEWQSAGGHYPSEIPSVFGYFTHSESASFEAFAKTSSEVRREVDYTHDQQYNVDVDIYTPVVQEVGSSMRLKVVKRGTGDTVRALEKEFLADADLFYRAKAGVSHKLPPKELSLAYNLLLLCSGAFLLLFLPFSISKYGSRLPDGYLFCLTGIYNGLAAVPSFLSYLTFALGVGCCVAFLAVRSKYAAFYKGGPSAAYVPLLLGAAIAAFAFGFVMNGGFQDLLESNNPILWVPVVLFCAGRAICYALSVASLFLSVFNLCKGRPHKTICAAIAADADTVNEYIGSGKYQRDQDLLKEIASYSLHADFERAAEVSAKIAELEGKRGELVALEEREFVDKSAEIAEIDGRLRRARAKLEQLIKQ